MVQGEAEDAEEYKNDVFAGDGGIWAGTRWGLGEDDCVDIGGGAKDVEGVAGAVEEEERVVEGAEDAGVDCHARRGRFVGADGFHGKSFNRLVRMR